jgi:hypothetical protein
MSLKRLEFNIIFPNDYLSINPKAKKLVRDLVIADSFDSGIMTVKKNLRLGLIDYIPTSKIILI